MSGKTNKSVKDVPTLPVRISYVCYVVKDIRKSMELFTKMFGVKNWRLWELPKGEDKIIIGRPAKQLLASGRIGSTFIDLRQPVSGKSIWSDFLENKGEGLHHVGYLVSNIDKKVSNLIKLGAIIREAGITDGRHWYCIEVTPGVLVEFEEAEGLKNTMLF